MRSWIIAVAFLVACEKRPAEAPEIEPVPGGEPAPSSEPASPEEPRPVGDATPTDAKHADLHELLEAMWRPNDQGEIPPEAGTNFQKALLVSDVYVPEKGEPKVHVLDTDGTKGWKVGIAPSFVAEPSKAVPAKEIVKAAVAKGLGIYWDGGNVFTFMTVDELKALLAR